MIRSSQKCRYTLHLSLLFPEADEARPDGTPGQDFWLRYIPRHLGRSFTPSSQPRHRPIFRNRRRKNFASFSRPPYPRGCFKCHKSYLQSSKGDDEGADRFRITADGQMALENAKKQLWFSPLNSALFSSQMTRKGVKWNGRAQQPLMMTKHSKMMTYECCHC